MYAGRLNEIITIHKLAVRKNDYGEDESAYIPATHTRAEVIYLNGARANENNEIVFNFDITFNIRIYHKVGYLDRIEWNERLYRILAIEVDKKFQMQKLRCEVIND